MLHFHLQEAVREIYRNVLEMDTAGVLVKIMYI